METIYEAPMIYTRIEWIWTDEGLEETFVETCEYEGEFMMCGGGSNNSGSESDSSSPEKQQMREQRQRERQEDQIIKERRNRQFNPSGNIYTQPTADPSPAPKTPEPSGGGGGWSGPEEPKIEASISTPEPEESGLRYVPGEGFKYNTTKERSDAAWEASSYATIHGTLKDSGHEDDPFLMNTTANLRTNDPDYTGSSGEGTGSATTTTATAETTGDDTTVVTDDSEEEPESTIGDEAALRRVRRRLRDRMGRRSTRGRGGAETVGTGYSLGG